MTKPKRNKRNRMPSEREHVMEAVFQGALAVIAKHRQQQQQEQEVQKDEKAVKEKQAVQATSNRVLRRGDHVVVDGVTYSFFRFNRKKQAVLYPVGEGVRTVIPKDKLLKEVS